MFVPNMMRLDRPRMDLALDFSVPDGCARLYDERGSYMGEYVIRRGEKCPPQARRAEVGPDVYFDLMGRDF